MLSAAIFLPLVFTISSVNIFASTFVVLLNLPVKKAFIAATDLFVSCWTELLALAAVLLVLYFAGFALGIGTLSLAKSLLKIFELNLLQAMGLQFPWIFIIIKTLGALLLWLLLGMLNAFLNIALLLFFLKKITPMKAEEIKAQAEPLPSPAA